MGQVLYFGVEVLLWTGRVLHLVLYVAVVHGPHHADVESHKIRHCKYVVPTETENTQVRGKNCVEWEVSGARREKEEEGRRKKEDQKR